MRTRRLRNWWPLAAVAGIAVAVACLLYLGWRSRLRDDLGTYVGSLAVPVAVIVVGWFAWALRKGTRRTADADDLDRAADRLAAVVQAQWQESAENRGLTGTPIRVTWGRPSLAMAGPVTAAAVGSRRFDPLPGLKPAGEAHLASGQAADLHALYGGYDQDG